MNASIKTQLYVLWNLFIINWRHVHIKTVVNNVYKSGLRASWQNGDKMTKLKHHVKPICHKMICLKNNVSILWSVLHNAFCLIVHIFMYFERKYMSLLYIVPRRNPYIRFILGFQYGRYSCDGSRSIGTTRPIPPNRRSCLGCIRWKDMSNPIRLRWNIVLTETYESRSAITNQSEHLEQRAIGTTGPITGDRAKYSMYSILYIDSDVTMC